ncbi:UNVERIFIED_CONTAM: hypothetical protein Sradi_0874200 [Sesamum radiatum]|uniref:Uncharacterized protein n=1 Tax=Sesamum radiatum TaxID=300843 RepID=A0AAW2V1S2_SESRA
MADFFWNCGTETKSHWVAWAKLCKPKNEGELSFRRLKECNVDVLSKQDWHGAMGSGGLLLAILSHKYFPHMSFFESRLGSHPSYTWRSLWSTMDILTVGLT